MFGRMHALISKTNLYFIITQMISYRKLVWAMALRELQVRYVGTFGGAIWAIAHPLATIVTYWFVFSVGFKIQPAGDVPFIVYFVSGLVPWLTFQEIISTSVGAITGAPHLVKKVVFPTAILPVVSLLASLVTHIALLCILLIILSVNGMPWSWTFLNAIYYLIAMYVFALGLGWFVCAINVFSRDVSQIVTVILGLWFWVTPIVWPSKMVGAAYHHLLMLNPMYFIVEGFRNSFLYGVPLWDGGIEHLYMWGICGIVFLIGGHIFLRLQPDFAEVL